MPEIHAFKDWWLANSEALFKRVDSTGNWWDEFQKCWDVAQDLELRRCARLTVHRLSLEAQVAQASNKKNLPEFLAAQEVMDKLTQEVEDE